MATPIIVADFESSLATAIAIGGTSFSLSSATDDDGVALPPGQYYFTVDNGSSNKEYFLGTLSGTSVTAVSTVTRQGVETSGAARAHRVGASVIITDFATYKKYIDGIAIAGAPDAGLATKGISTLSIAPISPTSPISVGDNDPRIAPNNYAVDAGSNDTYVISLPVAPAAYGAGQVIAFKAATKNTGPATLNVNGLGAKTITRPDGSSLQDNDIAAGQIVAVIYDGTNFRMQAMPPTISRFAGNGEDGALTITSGTTTIDLGGAAYVEKNYTAISITGTGKLAFSNPHANGTIIILKAQGDVTLTSSNVPLIDLKGLGASSGNEPTGLVFTDNVVHATNSTTTVGTAGTRPKSPDYYFNSANKIYGRGGVFLIPGAAGGDGGNGQSGTGGAGGRGAGALLIQCGGFLNFTGTIDASGSDGSAGSGSVDRASGGGGGGSAGMVAILYNNLTANSGTILAKGGAGATGGTGSGASGTAGRGGPGAASIFSNGGGGGNSNGAAAGSVGDLGAGSGGNSGGAGSQVTPAAAGTSMGGIVVKNTEYN